MMSYEKSILLNPLQDERKSSHNCDSLARRRDGFEMRISYAFPGEAYVRNSAKELPTKMSTQPETPEPFDPFGPWRVTRDATLETWSKLMIDFVNSEAYSQATSQGLDTYLTLSQPFQRAIETTMTQVLTELNMPTRADTTSLATRMTNIETRLDDLDIKLDEIQRAIGALSASSHATNTSARAKAKGAH
jgi:hypothetical protein